MLVIAPTGLNNTAQGRDLWERTLGLESQAGHAP
jgi:hypothetical protein